MASNLSTADPIEIGSAAAAYSGASFVVVKGDVRRHLGRIEKVHVTGDNYVVYTDADGHPHYAFDIGCEEPEGFNGVWNRVLAIEGLPRTNLSSLEVDHVQSRLANARVNRSRR